MHYSFVILHYMALEMTEQCVDLLLQNFGEDSINIVIVDNASSNGSGQELKNFYISNEKVSVILNSENLGFAKGNNIGYDYAKEHFNSDFIIVMNNDVLIDDLNFLKNIQPIYEKSDFAVLGPDIYNPFEIKHQNPGRLEPLTYNEAVKKHSEMIEGSKNFKKYYTKLFFNRKIRSNKILKAIFRFIKYKILKRNGIDYSKEYINPHLHGSCYIFSKKFIKSRTYAFNPATFLYYEEDILCYECKNQNLKMFYSPEIHIQHLEDVSTNMVYKSDYKKEEFKLKEMIKSSEVYINLVNRQQTQFYKQLKQCQVFDFVFEEIAA